MKRSMLCTLSLFIGIWLIAFQMASVSYGAPEPYVSTGFPKVVVVSGSNYDMGVQYGEQTAAVIEHNLALLKSRLYERYTKAVVDKDMLVWDYYNKKFDPGLQDWFKGIVKGCKKKKVKVSYSDIVLLMVYPSENWARPSTEYPEEATTKKKLKIARKKQLKALAQNRDIVPEPVYDDTEYHSCSSFAATGSATPDGKPIHGITQMVGPEVMDTVILIAFPEDGYSWVSQPYAGRVNGNSAMNSNGFTWTLTAIMSPNPVWGLITEAYFHYLAQYVATPTEAQSYLESTPRAGVTGGVTMTDAEGNISVFENNSAGYAIRLPGESGETDFTVMTNHITIPSIEGYVEPQPTNNSFRRYNSIFQFIVEAPDGVDFPYAKNMLASDDWYEPGVGWHENEPGGNGPSNAHSSVNQSIYFPADLVAYLQTGTASGNGLPAYATGEYVKIKLASDANAVTAQAGRDASSFYWKAADQFQSALNDNAAYVPYLVAQSISEQLDEAYVAYSLGMDREAYADLEENANAKLYLYSEALTNYAKAQLYAQMVITTLNSLSATP